MQMADCQCGQKQRHTCTSNVRLRWGLSCTNWSNGDYADGAFSLMAWHMMAKIPHFNTYSKCQWTERWLVILNKLKKWWYEFSGVPLQTFFPNQRVSASISLCTIYKSMYNLSAVSGYNRAPQVCDCVCVSISLQVNDVQWSMSSIVSRRPPYPATCYLLSRGGPRKN